MIFVIHFRDKENLEEPSKKLSRGLLWWWLSTQGGFSPSSPVLTNQGSAADLPPCLSLSVQMLS